jgi:hypothetical protein
LLGENGHRTDATGKAGRNVADLVTEVAHRELHLTRRDGGFGDFPLRTRGLLSAGGQSCLNIGSGSLEFGAEFVRLGTERCDCLPGIIRSGRDTAGISYDADADFSIGH